MSEAQLQRLIPTRYLVGKTWDEIKPEEPGMFAKY